jgi:hypothetical protein
VSDYHAFPAIDPDANTIVLAVGRKGSGKSVLARELFLGWPNVDRLVIDPTGDADPGEGAVTLTTIPKQLPERRRGGPPILARYVANPAAPTYHDDLDRALGLALYPKGRRVLVWIDEGGEVFPVNPGPNARTLLHQSRHWNASAIIACPRPKDIATLVPAQADYIAIFDVPSPHDRQRLAETMGWPPAKLNAALEDCTRRGAHWFLLFDARAHELYLCPPLPMTSPDKKAGT